MDHVVYEDFIGLYEVTTAANSENLEKMIMDVFLRVGLDVHRLRGQCYDRASISSGNVSGDAARTNVLKSRALYENCTMHSLNLEVQDATGRVPMLRGTLDLTRETINSVYHTLPVVALTGEEFRA